MTNRPLATRNFFRWEILYGIYAISTALESTWQVNCGSVQIPMSKTHSAADTGVGPIEREIIEHGSRPVGCRGRDDPVTDLRGAFDEIGRAHGAHVIEIVLLERSNEALIQPLVDLSVTQSARRDDDDLLIPRSLP